MIKVVSPAGTAVWPKLNEPDFRFDENGVYSVQLRMKKDECSELVEKLTAFHQQVHAAFSEDKGKKLKTADLPFKMVEDDEGKETGEVEFKFKLKAKTKTRSGEVYEKSPKIFDATGTPMNGEDIIGAGSTIKVASNVRGWYMPALGVGISLQIGAVQVIDLQRYEGGGGKTAQSWGFSKEEGFETVAPADAPTSGSDAADFDF